jgi:hypothetical protein
MKIDLSAYRVDASCEEIMVGDPKVLPDKIGLLLGILAVSLVTDGPRAQARLKFQIVSQIGHMGPVESVAFSPDGACVLSDGEDKTLTL